LKVWDLANMGYQATAHILGYTGSAVTDVDASATHDPLARLTTITGDFPSLSKWITTLKVPDSVREDVERNKQYVLLLLLCSLPVAFDCIFARFAPWPSVQELRPVHEFHSAEWNDV
jgi:hypothetical protein